MINPLKPLSLDAIKRITEITQVTRSSLCDSELKSNSEQITSPNGSPKYYQGLIQLQVLNRELNIDDPYDLLSMKDRGILLDLRTLERKYCRFQTLGLDTREKVLDILKEVDPIIQKADTEFGVAVINEKVFVVGCGQKDQIRASDSFLIKSSFYPINFFDRNPEIKENSFIAFTHNHPLLFQEPSSYVSSPLTLIDLIFFSNSSLNLFRAVDHGGPVYTVEASSSTEKALLADHLNNLGKNMDGGLISDMQELVKASGTLPPELHSSRDRILKYLKDFEGGLPVMAQQFGFTYSKTSLNQDDK